MKVLIDAFGGDNAPLAVLEGCVLALKEYNSEILIVGNKQKITQVAQDNNIDLSNIEIIDAQDTITMEDEPTDIIKSKSESSMAVGLKKLKEGYVDAFVSAGNTGALVVGATSIVKRIKGIKRAALATQIPTRKSSYMLLDVGANADCRSEMLLQFGIMGSAYMNGVMNINNPKVGLVNVGTEEHKGNSLAKESFALYKSSKAVNFIGNVEAREINNDVCDVAVCDGFTGNIILKLTEGMAKTLTGIIKDSIMSTTRGKIGGLIIKPSMNMVKSKLDYTEYGGAPLLGLEKPVIKAHGSSNAVAFKNAIRQAIDFYNQDVIGKIKDNLNKIKTNADIGD